MSADIEEWFSNGRSTDPRLSSSLASNLIDALEAVSALGEAVQTLRTAIPSLDSVETLLIEGGLHLEHAVHHWRDALRELEIEEVLGGPMV